ncbi:MAG: dihydrolipoyl dehydrogenase [Flavobacteriales bacterium]|nr:dihydrolipoyl dehydrogenase [Bacteroidota bacterium]MCB9240755.1 dihydrolipoyl dehydrogenase [Flavobacteriales bacterium]
MTYDLTVIGSGPGGYVAAIRAAQLGMKVAIIEKYPTLGGTCLNVGCIPSKALLDSSEHYHAAQHKFEAHGIEVKGLSVNFGQMMNRKSSVVDQMTKGVQFLMKKNKIDVYHGVGKFKDANTVLVEGEETHEISSTNIIIATGSKPSSLPGMEIDKKRVISSTEALTLKEIPGHLVVIGGGVIGMELGSVYNRLGSKVSVVEYMDSLIPTMDGDLGKELQRVHKKQGFDFYLGHKVTSVKTKGKKVIIDAEGKKGPIQLEADYCLVAVGRRPYTDGLDLQNAGLSTDERGRIPVNDHLQTAVSSIFAIGDVVQGAMLAHKAEEEGVFVAELLAGQKPHIDYNLVPGVVYTWPEVASVGQTEEQLKASGVAYKSGKFAFRVNGRAVAGMDLDGFVKILADEKTDEVLGVHIIGPRAADLIAEAVVAMEFRATAEDIARICHAHPTTSEVTKEAALAATGNRALHA